VNLALNYDGAPVIIDDEVKVNGNVLSATCISEDLDEAFVVLMDASYVDENEIVLLGMMFPDNMEETDQGYDISYTWDNTWLGINDEVAYISDLYVVEYEDDNNELQEFVVVETPAMLNGEDVIITFVIDAEGYYEVANISPDIDEATGILPKERITIKEGDELVLLYEGIDLTTEEEIWYESTTTTIVNSVDDIELHDIELPDGDYALGYYLSDFHQNETFVFADVLYNVVTSLDENSTSPQVNIYPQPASNYLTFEFPTDANYTIELIDMSGKVIQTFVANSTTNRVDVSSIPSGQYVAKFVSEKDTFTQKVVLQK